MPELPEVQTVVTELNQKLPNRKIKRVVIFNGKLISIGSATVSNIRKVSQSTVDNFAKIIKGQKIVSVKRRGKMLIFKLSGPYTILVHLKMTGQFIFEDLALKLKTGSKYRILNKLSAPLVKLPAKHTHVVFYFTDKSILYYNDVRQFGYLRLVKDTDLSNVKELNEYGPEPLDKSFTFKKFEEALKKRTKISIKLALMDTKVVVGIGNIYSDEILFHAKILPDRSVSSLSKIELVKIFDEIKPVLRLGVKYKGSSVGDFIRTDGKRGSMGKYHFVYGRKGQPCKVCGTIIKSIKLGGRTACFCHKEQK